MRSRAWPSTAAALAPGSRYKMHVLRLTTGKDVVLDNVSGSDTSNVQLEAPGLVCVKNSSTLVFVPLRRVLAAVP